MTTIELKEQLVDIFQVENKNIKEYQINVRDLKLEKIRDYLILNGKIYHEDKEEKLYVASICGGFAKKNQAFAAMYLTTEKLMIAIYAREGIINQKTTEGVIDEIKNYLKEYMG